MTFSVADGLDLLRARLADDLRLAVAITTDRDRPDLQVSVLTTRSRETATLAVNTERAG